MWTFVRSAALVLLTFPLAVDIGFAQGVEGSVVLPVSAPYVPLSSPIPQRSVPGGGVLEDSNGPLLYNDPLLDDGAPLGWFASVDADALVPHFKTTNLSGPVTVNGASATVQLPSANLAWMGSPRVELGYRMGEAAGELMASYRWVGSSGNDTIAGFDAAGNPASLHSRFDLHQLDLDYGTQENSLIPCVDMRWRVGVRLVDMIFSSDATAPLLFEHERDQFYGIGPKALLELRVPFRTTGLSLFSRFEGAVVLGNVHQDFDEVPLSAGSTPGSFHTVQMQPVPTLKVEAGVSWTPQWCHDVRFSVGYTIERWWAIEEAGTSMGDVTIQGVLVRGEWKY